MPPKVTVAVPSYNQGGYLEDAIKSILNQNINHQICVADGGSVDNSVSILEKYSSELYWWQSQEDGGQSQAVNKAVAMGDGEYVAWLNSDDLFLDNALAELVKALEENPHLPAVYGRAIYVDENGNKLGDVNTENFSRKALMSRCIICQPSVLMRREVWEAVEGLNSDLNMAMDYDLWWRIFNKFGDFGSIQSYVAAARLHSDTKTNNFRKEHYQEAIKVVRTHAGSVPLLWYFKIPWSVWYKSINKI